MSGSRSRLTREGVLRAAMRLADEEGVEALSMRTLGRALGVEAMSLYHHVANKDAILDGVVDLVFAEIDLPAPGAPWVDALRARTVSARHVLRRHPWAIGLLDSRRVPGPATLRHHDAVLGCLRRGGFSVPLAAHAISVLDAYLYGFALQELSLPFQTPEEVGEVAGGILASAPTDLYPHLAELVTQHVLRPGYAYGDEFAFGLDLILEALDRLLAAAR